MRYRFDDYELDTDAFELFRAGSKQKLQQQPAKVLAMLVARPGEVVSRDQILATLWGKDTFIEIDANINFAVRQLRLALGDRASEPRYVETLPRLGYRFIADVEVVHARHERVEEATTGTVRPAGRHRRWIAAAALGCLVAAFFAYRAIVSRMDGDAPPVVRFAPLHSVRGTPESEAFSEGLREQLVNALVRAYRGQVTVYASAQGDASVVPANGLWVTGSVDRPSDGLVRLDLRLAAPDGRSLWADSYEGGAGGLRDWTGDLPLKLASALSDGGPPRVSLAGEGSDQVDDVTYGRFLRGVYRTQTVFGALDPEIYRRGVEDLESVATTFPRFLDGQVALATAYLNGVGQFPPGAAFERATRLAAGVLSVDPQYPEALLARGEIALRAAWDVASAARDFRQAEQLNPGLARARHLLATALAAEGHTAEAVEAALDARRMDPENLFVLSDVGFFGMLDRQVEEAREAALDTIAVAPRSHLMHSVLLWTYRHEGDRAGALRETNRYLEAHGAKPAQSLEAYFERERRFLVFLRESGEPQPFNLADSMIRTGDRSEALEVLLDACRERADEMLLFAKSDPRLDPIRPLPGFSELLACISGMSSA